MKSVSREAISTDFFSISLLEDIVTRVACKTRRGDAVS